jgi:hypothetical protein
MLPIATQNNRIDDLYLQKYLDAKKISDILSFSDKSDKNSKNGSLIKTASSGNQGNPNDTIILLFTKMLDCLNLKYDSDSVKNVIASLSKKESKTLIDMPEFNKQASRISAERHDDIKIVSKSIKDSHYQVDVSKDVISKSGKKMFMISCYARDAYLGRYLIKRNYFYTEDREKFANDSYEEILTKVGAIKDRYYNEVIDVSEIFAQMKKVLDGVISEIKSEEDSVATNINR